MLLHGHCPTCDSIGDAEEAWRPLPGSERLPVIAISEAYPQQLLPYGFIPQAIDERVTHGAAERQPCHQSLQPLRHTALPPQRFCTHHPNVWPPGQKEGAYHHQDGDKSLALTPCIYKAPTASVRGSWGAWVLASVPLSSYGVILSHNCPTVHFAGFHTSNTEDDTVTGKHDEEGRKDAPRDPEGGVARLSVPRRNTRPLEAVELKRGPAKQRRQAAHQRMQPHIGDDDNRPVPCDFHWVDHRVEHSIVPDVGKREMIDLEPSDTNTNTLMCFPKRQK